MTHADDARLGRTVTTLSEIAHALESPADASARVRHALSLMRRIVPYERCSLLTHVAGLAREVFVVPDASEEEHARILRTLVALFRLVGEGAEPTAPVGRSGRHLTVPVMGLDRVIGLLRVEAPDDTAYEAHHVSIVSLVAAQLGAYITTFRLHEEGVKRARELEAGRDFLQLLTGIVSHDLRAPLTVIMTAASLLERDGETPRRTKAVRRILPAARVARRIIEDLLDVTQARVTGMLKIERRPADAVSLLTEAVEGARLAHPEREIRFAAPDEPITVEWDPDRVIQLVSNLLTNALKYGMEDAPVVVSVASRSSDVVVSVHNRGPAIPAPLLSVIFDPFVRGRERPERAATGGLGLGLFIVSEIARAHGGRVEATSSDSSGTTFSVCLPRGHGESSADSRRAG